jgi:O-antigen/teichoic acid export membrane protein
VWLARSWTRFAVRWASVRRSCQEHWRFGRWVLLDQGVAVTAGFSMHWLLGWFGGTDAAGVFGACLAVVQLANPVIMGLGNVLEPRMSLLVAEGGYPLVRRSAIALSARLACALAALALVFSIVGGPLVRLLFDDPEFAASTAIMVLLALGMLAMGMSVGVLHALRAVQRSQVNVVAGVAAFAVTLLVGVIGVPRWGMLAAAGALLAGHLVGLTVRWWGFAAEPADATERRGR